MDKKWTSNRQEYRYYHVTHLSTGFRDTPRFPTNFLSMVCGLIVAALYSKGLGSMNKLHPHTFIHAAILDFRRCRRNELAGVDGKCLRRFLAARQQRIDIVTAREGSAVPVASVPQCPQRPISATDRNNEASILSCLQSLRST
jgi:hypothetical protein